MKITITCLLALLMLSCYNNEDFTFKYSIESSSNLKTTLTFNKIDSTLKLEELNFFFDNFEGKKEPIYHTAKLSPEEYSKFIEKINISHLFEMEDSYGMSEINKVTGKILIQLFYVSNRREKYITIRHSITNSFPKEFIELINYCNQKVTEIKQTGSSL